MTAPPSLPAPTLDAGEAVALIRAIEDACTVADAAAVRQRASQLPASRVPPLPLEVLERYSAEDLRHHLWGQFGSGLEKLAAPALYEHLLQVYLTTVIVPPDAVSTAEALVTLVRNVSPLRHGKPQGPLQTALEKVASALAQRACESTERLRRMLDAPDFPDLQAISLHVLRIEGVRWVLEILEHQPSLELLSAHARRLSRRTLTRAAETIRGFIGKPDLMALYDNVAVVSQVDNLLTVAARLLDALRDEEEERTHFVAPDDEVALRGFGAALTELSEMLARIAMKAAGRTDVSPALVAATLGQMTFLYQFSSRMGEGRPPEFAALEESLRRNTYAFIAKFEETVSEVIRRNGTDQSLGPVRSQMRALITLLSAMGLDTAAWETLDRRAGAPG